ncbi:MAG: ribosome-associated translation inhibitor RaiA [Lacipirellulaceae bacterium]
MQISVATRHGHLSEASQEKLKKKADKLTRIFDRITSIEIVVDLEDQIHPKVTLEVSAEHKHDFVAHETADRADSLMGAVESAIAKIEQQLRKYKTKVQERHRNPDARRAEVPVGEDEEE